MQWIKGRERERERRRDQRLTLRKCARLLNAFEMRKVEELSRPVEISSMKRHGRRPTIISPVVTRFF